MQNEYERRGGSHRMEDLEAEALNRQQAANAATLSGADQTAPKETVTKEPGDKPAK